MMKRNKGITLVALIITIIILLILAGISIVGLTKNGLFENAKIAKQKQSEQESREKLELALANARIEKETNTSFNDEYLDNMLKEQNIIVNGNSVIVDDYNFLIDREQLKIIEKTQITIGSIEDLITFRDNVNKGLTYEGKTIILTQDLDLSSVCHQVDGKTENDISWTPIGTSTNHFKGTFDGNNKCISNLYINSDSQDSYALFGYIDNAIIKNLKVSGTVKTTTNIAGGTVYNAANSSLIKIVNNINVESNYIAGGLLTMIDTEENEMNIIRCINNGNITVKNTEKGKNGYVGGILGYINRARKVTVSESFNTGIIDGEATNITFVGGLLGENDGTINLKIENCYNVGKCQGNSKAYIGGIIGYYNNVKNIENIYLNIENSYNAGKIETTSSMKRRSYRSS